MKKVFAFLFVAIFIATVSCVPVSDVFGAPGKVWKKVLSSPFYPTYGDKDVLAMAAFRGTVYAGVGRTVGGGATPSANILRLVYRGCEKVWDYFTPPWASDTGGYTMAMEVFKSKLYVGTDQGEVWRTDGFRWQNWQDVTGSWGTPSSIYDMAVFVGGGKVGLYMTFVGSGEVWRTSDGVSWGLSANLATLDSRIYDVLALKVFNGYLYAGVGLSFYVGTVQLKGIQLWRTKNGVDWAMFKEVVQPFDSFILYPEHVHALEAFKDNLYVGEYHGSGLYRTDGVSSWDYIDTQVVVGGGVFRLERHCNKLYLGMNDWFSTDSFLGDYLLYSSTDGVTWSGEPGYPVVDSNTQTVGSLLSFGAELYVGLHGRVQATAGTMEIWRLGPPKPFCFF